jgi:hypothetical protein
MSATKGGSRPGAGKPSNATRHATRIETFTDKCAGHLRRAYENVKKIADGDTKRIETEGARAGTITRKDVARDKHGEAIRDKNGKLTVIDVLVYPDLPADQWVWFKRKAIHLPPDLKANQEIADRVMGRPRQAVELGNGESGPLRIEVFEQAVARFYGHPEPEPDVSVTDPD